MTPLTINMTFVYAKFLSSLASSFNPLKPNFISTLVEINFLELKLELKKQFKHGESLSRLINARDSKELRLQTNLALPWIKLWSRNISRPGLPCFLPMFPRCSQAYHLMTGIALQRYEKNTKSFVKVPFSLLTILGKKTAPQ